MNADEGKIVIAGKIAIVQQIGSEIQISMSCPTVEKASLTLSQIKRILDAKGEINITVRRQP
jgi:hypothetical protein